MSNFSRRNFVRGAGAGLLFAPFLSLLEGKKAKGATKKAKRLVVFCTMGTHPTMWAPTASGETITAFSDATKPLDAIKQNIVIVDNCPSSSNEGHGSLQGLSGRSFATSYQATSVEQFISDGLKASGVKSAVPVLLVGDGTTLTDPGGGKVQFVRNGTLLFPTGSPKTAYTNVFGNGVPAGTSTDTLKGRRTRVTSLLEDEITEIEKRLGPAERDRLEKHRLSIQQIESRLSMTGSSGGGTCSQPAVPTDSKDVLTNDHVFLDIVVSALACDITRVAGIHYGNDQVLPVNLSNLSLSGNQHSDFIHSGEQDNYQRLMKFEAYLAGEFVYLVQKLASIPEADGSGMLLDNTIVAWCRDMGDALAHNQLSMKFVLASGTNGYLKTNPMGRYVKRGGVVGVDGHERVLLNLCEAMGITSYSSFGDPNTSAANKKPLDGIAA
jgi:hypothetical protein